MSRISMWKLNFGIIFLQWACNDFTIAVFEQLVFYCRNRSKPATRDCDFSSLPIFQTIFFSFEGSKSRDST